MTRSITLRTYRIRFLLGIAAILGLCAAVLHPQPAQAASVRPSAAAVQTSNLPLAGPADNPCTGRYTEGAIGLYGPSPSTVPG